MTKRLFDSRLPSPYVWLSNDHASDEKTTRQPRVREPVPFTVAHAPPCTAARRNIAEKRCVASIPDALESPKKPVILIRFLFVFIHRGVPSDSKWARRISVEDDDSGESDCSAPSPSLWLVDEATDPLLRNGAYHHLETVPKAETIRRRRRLLGYASHEFVSCTIISRSNCRNDADWSRARVTSQSLQYLVSSVLKRNLNRVFPFSRCRWFY